MRNMPIIFYTHSQITIKKNIFRFILSYTTNLVIPIYDIQPIKT